MSVGSLRGSSGGTSPSRRYKGRREMRRSLLFFLLGLALILASPLIAEEDHYKGLRVTRLKERVEAPDFTLSLVDRNGETEKSLRDFRGKVILLNFWASWCPPCREEMPSLERLYRAFKDRGFMVIGVNYMERAETVMKFKRDFDLTFPSFLDKDGRVSERYRVMGIPTSFLIDRKGRVVAKVLGDREWDNEHGRAIVESLLKEQ